MQSTVKKQTTVTWKLSCQRLKYHFICPVIFPSTISEILYVLKQNKMIALKKDIHKRFFKHINNGQLILLLLWENRNSECYKVDLKRIPDVLQLSYTLGCLHCKYTGNSEDVLESVHLLKAIISFCSPSSVNYRALL